MKLHPVTLEDIRSAQKRIAGIAIRTPLIRLNFHETPHEIYLKLENLQPIGSFKVRGAGNAMQKAGLEKLSDGVVTASAGNMAQGVGWNAKRLGIRWTVVVPDHAPETKLAAIQRLGGEIVNVPFDEWWNVIVTHHFERAHGFFIHPVANSDVIAGNGTIGLEILEDLPDASDVLVPYGGGGLSCGIATAIRALKSEVRIHACEVETAAPFAASLRAGRPAEAQYTPSFVDGIGGKTVLQEMWPLASSLLSDSIVVTPAEIASAIRMLIERNHVVAEGAGAASVAAALKQDFTGKKIVCVVSGGNIDSPKLIQILSREI
jgi:threonine dehydratase